MEEGLRRIAAHTIILPDGSRLQGQVVELYGGRVVNYYPLEGELPMTEWLGSCVRLSADGTTTPVRDDRSLPSAEGQCGSEPQ